MPRMAPVGVRRGALRPPIFDPPGGDGIRITVTDETALHARQSSLAERLCCCGLVSWCSPRRVPVGSAAYHLAAWLAIAALLALSFGAMSAGGHSLSDLESEENLSAYRWLLLLSALVACAYVTTLLQEALHALVDSRCASSPRHGDYAVAVRQFSLVATGLALRFGHGAVLGPAVDESSRVSAWAWVLVAIGVGLGLTEAITDRLLHSFSRRRRLGGLVRLRFAEALLRDLTLHDPDAAPDAAGARPLRASPAAEEAPPPKGDSLVDVVAMSAGAFMRVISRAVAGPGAPSSGPAAASAAAAADALPPSLLDEWLAGLELREDGAAADEVPSRVVDATAPPRLRQSRLGRPAPAGSPSDSSGAEEAPPPVMEAEAGRLEAEAGHLEASSACPSSRPPRSVTEMARRNAPWGARRRRSPEEEARRAARKRRRRRLRGQSDADDHVVSRMERRIFETLGCADSDKLTVEDFERRYESNTAMSAYNLFSVDTTGVLTREDVRGGVRGYFTLHTSTRAHLDDIQSVADFVRSLVHAGCYATIFIVCLSLIGVDVAQLMLALFSLLLSLSFAFQTTITNMVESMIMLLVVQPFAVGDRLRVREWGATKYWVDRVALTSTKLRDTLGNVTVCPNFVLAALDLANLTRSKNAGVVIELEVSFHTPMEKLRGLVDFTAGLLVRDRSSWHPSLAPFVDRAAQTTTVTLAMWLEHRLAASESAVIGRDTTTLLNELRERMTAEGIQWRAPVRRVAVVHASDLDSADENALDSGDDS